MSRTFVMDVTDAPRASTGQLDILGSHRTIGNKVYKFVRIVTAAQSTDVNVTANGDALGYTDMSGHLVGTDATDAAEGPAGVVSNFANWDGDISAVLGYYMWIQIKGNATVQSVTTATTFDKIEYSTSSTDLIFDKITTLKADCGYMVTATTEIYLDCPY